MLNATYPIDILNPVNRDSSLNVGKIAWYLGLPGLDGGKYFQDLMRVYPGIITGMGVGYGWQPTARQGGFGQLAFNIGNSWITVGTAGASSLNAFTNPSQTVSAWINPVGSSYRQVVSKNNNIGWRFRVNSNQTLGFLDRGGTNAVNSTGTVTNGVWTHVAVVVGPSGISFYINGRFDSSGGSAFGASTDTSVFYIGQDGAGTETFNGLMDDISVYNRAFSASEIQSLYGESLNNYQTTLNRIFPKFFLFSASSVFTESINHSLSLSQILSVGHVNRRSVSESLSFYSVLNISRLSSRQLSQTLSLTSQISFNVVLVKSISQTFSFSQSLVVISQRNYQVSQSLSLTSQISRRVILQKSISDTLSFSDSSFFSDSAIHTVSNSLSFSQSLSRVRTSFQSLNQRLILLETSTRNITYKRPVSDFLNVSDHVQLIPVFSTISVVIPSVIPEPNQYNIQLYRYGKRLLLPSPKKLDMQTNMQMVTINGFQKFMPRVMMTLYFNNLPPQINRFIERNIIFQNKRYELYSGYLYRVAALQLQFDGVRI